jgi:small subunit ribosomal protein S6
MFLVDSAVASSRWDEVMAAINLIFERAEADVISVKKWDERRLCYEIAGQKRGTYILSYFHGFPSKISSMERDVRLNDLILRAIFLRGDHLTDDLMDHPTPAMLNAEHEDRDSDDNEDQVDSPDEELETEVPAFDALEIETEEVKTKTVTRSKSAAESPTSESSAD